MVRCFRMKITHTLFCTHPHPKFTPHHVHPRSDPLSLLDARAFTHQIKRSCTQSIRFEAARFVKIKSPIT
jgi:hypothetical protein